MARAPSYWSFNYQAQTFRKSKQQGLLNIESIVKTKTLYLTFHLLPTKPRKSLAFEIFLVVSHEYTFYPKLPRKGCIYVYQTRAGLESIEELMPY